MAQTFTVYDGTSTGLLVDALLAPASGIVVDQASIVLRASAADAVNLYDGSITELGIGAGLLLTSGTTPGTSNTSSGFGTDNSIGPDGFSNGDSDIDAVVSTVFQTQSYDATTLSFSFTVSDPTATSISFDIVFGSDEYPEWVDQFVDSAIVMVNGVNYALFNHDPLHPLSVITPNLAAGYFQNNDATQLLPVEYDGVSHVLKIVAPIQAGAVNTIKIGIADTGDHILDSGIFLANLSAGTTPGSGVVDNPGGCTQGNDVVSGTAKDEFFDLQAGDDTVYAGGGDDILVAGSGKDLLYGGSGNDELQGQAGDDRLDGGSEHDTAVYAGLSSGYTLQLDALTGVWTIDGSLYGEGIDSLTGVESLRFADGLFDLTAAGLVPQGSPPPVLDQPGLAIVSGLGKVDATLTASVSDGDGLDPALLSLRWQRSTDQGASWNDIAGATGLGYVVQNKDQGSWLRVSATYTDAAGHAAAVVSLPKSILSSVSGDLKVTLMQLAAPAGSLLATPLTTLVQRAIDLGLSPNQAAKAIRSALGLPVTVDLGSYDAVAVLQANPADATARRVEAVAVQVAVIASLSDDDSGIQLTLAILDALAADPAVVLDLSRESTVAAILGINSADPTALPRFNEILDRNGAIASDLKDGKDVLASVTREWRDVLSVSDLNAAKGIAALTEQINLAPVGWATATLPEAMQDSSVLLSAATLLAGFTDPNGDPLTVGALCADAGSLVANVNGLGDPDGTWTWTPDAGFVGPVEFSYLVEDGQGGSVAAAQMLVVAPAPVAPNHAPEGEVLISGEAVQGATLTLSDTLSDADGLGTLSLQWRADGVDLAGAVGDSLLLDQSLVGHAISVVASYVDGLGTPESVTSASTAAVANVDDPASGTLAVSGLAQEGGSLQAALSGVSDPDGPTSISYRWQQSLAGVWGDLAGQSSAALAIPADQSLVGHTVRVVATTHDALGGSTDFLGDALTIANVNDAPSGGVSVTGTLQQGQTLTAGHNLADEDGLGAVTFLWQRASGPLGTFTTVASGSTYLLGAADVGQVLRVEADYTDGWGTGEAVRSAVTAAVTQPAGVTLSGTSAANTLNGTVWNDSLSGLGGNDTLNGLAGNDRLDGGSGNDSLNGGDGNDTYVVDSSNDKVIETGSDPLVGGVDQIESSVSLSSLAANVERLTLTGGGAINGTGNALANLLVGNTGANQLSGAAGVDTLIGADGNDVLVGGSEADRLQGGTGVDTFRFALADSRLSGIDVITDLVIGTDVIDGPSAVSAANLRELGVAASLAAADLQALLTATTFGKSGAASFSVVDPLAGTRTFLALNGSTAGFQASEDALIEITGHSGSLTQLAVI